MATEPELQEWWDRLSATDRDTVKTAVIDHRPDDMDVAKLLAASGCPVAPTNSGWEAGAAPSGAGAVPEYVLGFIASR